MRRTAATVLVLAIASATASLATGPGTTARAQDGPPPPVVVTIDPGHGGIPNPNDPTQPFDPGAIGGNGVEEKDVALDVAKRVAGLLRQDLVQPVLTRSTDVWMTIAAREQVAVDAHAAVFVSIHCNSWTDPSAAGSLVLYPNAMGQPLAQALSAALGRDLASAQVPDDGTQIRADWWIHAPMPTSTVEMAYLSNPHEAALLATEPFREQVAIAIRDGIEAFDPQIATTKAAIVAWQREHPAQPTPTATPVPQHVAATVHRGGGGVPGILPWLAALAALAAAVRFRHSLAPVAFAALDLVPVNRRALHRMAARRRRQKLRARSLVRDAGATHRRSVYDDLSF